MPEVEFDKNNLTELTEDCIEHGLLKDHEIEIELEGQTYLL